MALPQPDLTLRAARSRYFEANALPADGGYDVRWIRASSGRIPLYFLNTRPRKRAVPYHDLHHVLADYDTTSAGEAEMGAWELAAGTRPHWMATALDLAAVAIGLLIAPRRTFRAFARGRRCRSLYPEPYSEELLDQTVERVRARLGLQAASAAPTLGDGVRFAGLAALSLLALLAFFVLGPLLLLIGPLLP